MKSKILNGLAIVASLFGYLEWGKDSSAFLFRAEAEILSKLFSDPLSVVHPFTVLPLTGQILLLITLFQRHPSKLLSLAGIGCIGILFALMFVIGMISFNMKIVVSTVPFLVCGITIIIHQRKKMRGNYS
jgi:hypothetical protein